MRREIPYRVVLPENYDESEKHYPVFYLLHGLFGCCDNWLELTNLEDYARERELIIVLPEGGNGWYTDSVENEEEKHESYFIKELIPEIDLSYKTLKTGEKRAIAGLSMGGYGALKFALKRPDLFVFAASISGAFSAPEQSKENPGFDWENLGESITKVFGAEGSQTRIENDLFELIRQIPFDNVDRYPHFYIDCGIEDGFLKVNRELTALLKEKMFSFEYQEVAGGHDWDYWDKEIKHLLPIVENFLEKRI